MSTLVTVVDGVLHRSDPPRRRGALGQRIAAASGCLPDRHGAPPQ